ncbi:Replicase polyprotein 1ab [Labeo rohita]|uniref:Replicase polyprotein 1ab n=1 Tax=Labeo rohita TaxID=84645 RepID=A0ABQ8LP17_LABRO|nr:Replicase polyprotein 1ab [Labeo rohita]
MSIILSIFLFSCPFLSTFLLSCPSLYFLPILLSFYPHLKCSCPSFSLVLLSISVYFLSTFLSLLVHVPILFSVHLSIHSCFFLSIFVHISPFLSIVLCFPLCFSWLSVCPYFCLFLFVFCPHFSFPVHLPVSFPVHFSSTVHSCFFLSILSTFLLSCPSLYFSPAFSFSIHICDVPVYLLVLFSCQFLSTHVYLSVHISISCLLFVHIFVYSRPRSCLFFSPSLCPQLFFPVHFVHISVSFCPSLSLPIPLYYRFFLYTLLLFLSTILSHSSILFCPHLSLPVHFIHISVSLCPSLPFFPTNYTLAKTVRYKP